MEWTMKELLVLNLVAQEMQAVSASPDGATVRTLVSGLDETPDGVVVDAERGHVYWTNMGPADEGSDPRARTFFTRNGSIERIDLDGGNRVTVLPRGSFTTGKQLTADLDEGKLYWCDREGMQVLRCNLDGSDLEPLVVVATGEEAARQPRNHPVGIAVDPASRTLYWTQKGAPKAGEGRIFRTSIDRPDEVELLFEGLPEPIDLHLDAHGTLLWTDRGRPPEGNTLNRARVTPGIGTPEICAGDFKEAIGMATADEQTYYVGDLEEGRIRAIDVVAGTDRDVIVLGPGLTGLAVADL
ncbi:hypothetical protein GCM10011519_12530 [Marmoricola endophyticus]|uniref:3-hydroxyacyl-CoA dehydrogenase n=1 Tax=Marmoricola endophyticus TaxID=2040280 RepID=A0A917F3Z1_9ACTN|nr:hypothetical protein [Marmoricola endophyticus]GGF40337.1 hypothetical protein GCM10011519_12530 [Marmoricola endophyticus]